jgi:hypothetical protein
MGVDVIDHGPDKVLGLAAPGGYKDVIATADMTENDGLIGEFIRI